MRDLNKTRQCCDRKWEMTCDAPIMIRKLDPEVVHKEAYD